MWYYNSSSYGPLKTIIVIYAHGYIGQSCWLLVTIGTMLKFDSNCIGYDKIAMGKMMAYLMTGTSNVFQAVMDNWAFKTSVKHIANKQLHVYRYGRRTGRKSITEADLDFNIIKQNNKTTDHGSPVFKSMAEYTHQHSWISGEGHNFTTQVN